MIPYILMGIGGFFLAVSVVGFLLYILEPFYRNYQIVIKRKDDYSHFNNPKGMKLLQSERQKYKQRVAFFFVVGLLLFGCGYRMKFGSRGLGRESGEYVSETGEKYDVLFVVHGEDILYKGLKVEDLSEVDEILDDAMKNGGIKVYIRDEYAASVTFHDLIDRVNKKGCSFEYDR